MTIIIKNTGLVKDLKSDGIVIKINPGINILDDSGVLQKIVNMHPDLSIVNIEDAASTILDFTSVATVVEEEKKITDNADTQIDEESIEDEDVPADDSSMSIEEKKQNFQSFKKNRKGRK